MSKRLSKIILFLSFVLVLPLVMTLTGCGATPVNDAKSVKFVSNLYDEETGYAVFEVDINKPTELTYKINPSSNSGYAVQIQEMEDDYENATDNHINYYMDNNNIDPETKKVVEDKPLCITVFNKNFKQIKVRIYISVSDTDVIEDFCLVRLKEYPSEIYLDETPNPVLNENNEVVYDKTDYINAGGVYSIHVFGKFTENVITNTVDEDGNVISTVTQHSETREITDDVYRFKVESSDQTVINVLDNSRLKVCSLKNKLESAVITISMVDINGNLIADGFVLKLHLTVVLSPKYSLLTLDGVNKFVKGNTEITNAEKDEEVHINLAESKIYSDNIHESLYYFINFDIELFDSSDVYIKYDEYFISCASDAQDFVIFDNENQIIKVRKQSNSNILKARIFITTSANAISGGSFSTSFTLVCEFPTE